MKLLEVRARVAEGVFAIGALNIDSGRVPVFQVQEIQVIRGASGEPDVTAVDSLLTGPVRVGPASATSGRMTTYSRKTCI